MEIKNKNSLSTLLTFVCNSFQFGVLDGQSGGENSSHFSHTRFLALSLSPFVYVCVVFFHIKKLHHSDLTHKNVVCTPLETWILFGCWFAQSLACFLARSLRSFYSHTIEPFRFDLGPLEKLLLFYCFSPWHFSCLIMWNTIDVRCDEENRHLLFISSILM